MQILDIESGGLFFDNSNSASSLTFNLETSITIFEQATLINPRLTDNLLGCYTLVPVGRDGEARFASFSVPKYQIRPRSKRCGFNPTSGKIEIQTGTIQTCNYEINNVICTDMLWDSCWEKILGVGQGKFDWNSSTEASQLLARIIDRQMQGYGNDLYDIATYANHPLINESSAGKKYRNCNVEDDLFEAYYAMLNSCNVSGHLTIIDGLTTHATYNKHHSTITAVDSTGAYIGNGIDDFKRLEELASPELRQFNKANTSDRMATVGAANPMGKTIIKVSRSLYNAYKSYLERTYQGISQSFYLTVHGETYGCDTCGLSTIKGVLHWNDYLVVCSDEWDEFEQMTGTIQHRAIMMAPGVLGIAYDVIPDVNGIGLKFDRWNMAPYLGQTFVTANFKLGSEVLDPKYLTSLYYVTDKESK